MYSLLFSAKITLIIDIIKFYYTFFSIYYTKELILIINSRPLKTIFQHKVCTDKLYADSFYKAQKSSHSSFEVICCRS